MGTALFAAALVTLFSFAVRCEASTATNASIRHGRYLAEAGDCAACHTADGGKPFAGGRPVPTPFGVIYSTNITPDKDTGIGNWTEQDFYRAMHEGMRPDGTHLYPAFPYPWYTKLSRQDVDDVKAFLSTLPPVHEENRPTGLHWPFSVREGMAAWNKMFFHAGSYQPDPSKSQQWNRGAYLVEGLGHCGACHTPKNSAGAVKKKEFLTGGYGENWFATNLTGAVRDGLGNWSPKEIEEYLKSGSNDKAAATGPMAEVIQHSTQHLDDADLAAIATYLKDLKGSEPDQKAATDKDVLARGAALYKDQCTGCHMENGEGIPDVFPPLKGNAVVQANDPETLLHIVLDGAKIVSTASKPTGLAMPAFGGKLTDQDISDLATYLRGAWGNRASAVDEKKVAKVRAAVEKAEGR